MGKNRANTNGRHVIIGTRATKCTRVMIVGTRTKTSANIEWILVGFDVLTNKGWMWIRHASTHSGHTIIGCVAKEFKVIESRASADERYELLKYYAPVIFSKTTLWDNTLKS